MQRAIITGATGAIGTALTKELISNNVEVLIFTRKDSKRNSVILKHPLVSVKYCSLSELKDMSNDTGKEYDVFYHLAWAGASGPGRNDKDLQDNNVKYALDAVECAKRFGCQKFVGVGSQAEYGRVKVPLTPELECNPENEYGRAKLETGRKAKELADSLDMQFNWVRVLSVYGSNDGENSLISYTIRELSNGKVPELTKGEQIWDYLYSEDAARALYLIGEKGINGKTYVLGSGETRTLKEYIERLRDVVAPGGELNFGAKEYPDKQVMYLQADTSELYKDTGWKAEMPFEEGIRKISEAGKNDSALWQFIKFGIVGVSNTAISLGIYYLFIFINKDLYLLGSIAGFLISVLNSFYWNNKYVFKTEGQKNWFIRLLKTYISYGGTTLLSTFLLYLEVEHFGISEAIAPLINMAITVPLNFIINKVWAFRRGEQSSR